MAQIVEIASLEDAEEILRSDLLCHPNMFLLLSFHHSTTRIINEAYQIECDDNSSPYGFKSGPRFQSIEDEVLVKACLEERIFKVMMDEMIVGVVFWQQISSSTLYFGPFAVSPDHQGKGIGKLLLKKVEDLAREKNLTELAIKVVNHRKDLIPWYESLGYRTVGEMVWPKSHEHILTKPSFFYEMKRFLVSSSPVSSSAEATIVFRGSCHCQAVTYSVTEPPMNVCYCHCSICRHISGSIVVPWLTVSSKSHIRLSGQEYLRTYHSSPEFCRQFCSNCGSHLFFRRDPSLIEDCEIDISYGSVNASDRARYPPTHHIWYGSKENVDYSESLPRYCERKETNP
jgi:GNAT superfamily N-acetyltransferase